ncbi:metallophosphoesterase [Bacillus lacus]|uniref:Metallophosphoesterase n=1 Tax=Metabacillus lacus TaxID=1983721 RepID=A0A7X2J1R5_9BACI|nr:metallophosphoesterase [Metabacillus lacus]MRX73736.1 metallophosphoesterase [Metabacillus lacus]
MRKRIRLSLLIVFSGVLLLGTFFYIQNNGIVTTEMVISSEKIPSDFENYKIVQLSDLHSKSFGKNQRQLVDKVEKLNPDIIVFTGDLVDANRYDEDISLLLMQELVKLAPVYFVTGNHEWWSGHFDTLEEKLQETGVHVLRNSTVSILSGEDSILLTGIDDPAYPASSQESYAEQSRIEENILSSLDGSEKGHFHILLSHRPEMLSLYSQYDFHLVFSGHAHGGQVRIPFVGGLIAPNQGFLPKYTSGRHKVKDTVMIVNRGLGNSVIPLRIFNQPEIVSVTLSSNS